MPLNVRINLGVSCGVIRLGGLGLVKLVFILV